MQALRCTLRAIITMTHRVCATVVCLILLSMFAQAAGVVGPVVISNNTGKSSYVSYTIPWTSDAAGNANATTFQVTNWGRLVQVEFSPGAGGTQPTALYDIVLNDARGVDYLSGSGANLSNTVSTLVTPAAPVLVGSATLELQVSNAGITKSGTVVVWVGP